MPDGDDAAAPFTWPVPEEPPGLDRDTRLEVLAHGGIEVVGRMPWSSNGTFLLTVGADGVVLPAVNKPQRGERPLWDFPDGTLYERELASFAVSDALGWSLVPESVDRDGPFGPGVVQRFVHHDPGETYFTLLPEHNERMREFAVFDVLINNADRKGGHCLRDRATGAIFGIDHGLSFHTEGKLRTVIWDFAGDALTEEERSAVVRVLCDDDLDIRLHALLSHQEVARFRSRAEDLLHAGVFPSPDEGYHSVPWPLV